MTCKIKMIKKDLILIVIMDNNRKIKTRVLQKKWKNQNTREKLVQILNPNNLVFLLEIFYVGTMKLKVYKKRIKKRIRIKRNEHMITQVIGYI